ncbi:MAG: hypothetical protein ACI308_09820 [Muribaculaceae bacterium]
MMITIFYFCADDKNQNTFALNCLMADLGLINCKNNSFSRSEAKLFLRESLPHGAKLLR